MVSQEQVDAINMALNSSQEQVATLSRAIDSVRAEASNAVGDLRNVLAAEQQRGQALAAQMESRTERGGRPVSFVNIKNFDGGQFTGLKGENFRAWSKKAKIYCNALRRGVQEGIGVSRAA